MSKFYTLVHYLKMSISESDRCGFETPPHRKSVYDYSVNHE